jgi:hypothetical protein
MDKEQLRWAKKEMDRAHQQITENDQQPAGSEEFSTNGQEKKRNLIVEVMWLLSTIWFE